MKDIIIEGRDFVGTKIKHTWFITNIAPLYIGCELASTLAHNEACLKGDYWKASREAYGDIRYLVRFYNAHQESELDKIIWVEYNPDYLKTPRHLIKSLVEGEGFNEKIVTDYVIKNLDNLKAFDCASAYYLAKKNLKGE